MSARRVLALALALLTSSAAPALAAPAAAATIGHVNPVERINFGGDYLQMPALAVNDDGDAVTVWRQDDGAPTYIWASRSHGGGPWSEAIRLSEYTIYDPQGPRAAAGPAGSFLVTWTLGSSSDFYYTWYHPATGWDRPQIASISPGHAIADMQIAADGLGNAFAVVFEGVASSYNLSAVRYNAGSGWGSMAALEGSTDDISPTEFHVVADAGGNAMAVWVQIENTWQSVLANRYTPGTGWQGSVHLEQDLNRSHQRVHLVGAPSGEVVAAWAYGDGMRQRAAAATYTPGSGWSPYAVVDQMVVGDVYTIDVAFAGSQAVVVWTWLNGSYYDLNGATGSGASWGEQTNLSHSAAGQEARVAGSARSGTAVVSWLGSDGHFNATRYVAGEGWSAPARLLEADPTYVSGVWVTAADGQGNTAVVWFTTTPVEVVYALWIRDSVAPAVNVTAPGPFSVVGESSVEVTGSVEQGAWVAANGVVADVDEFGGYSARVPLHAGSNTITVVARDAAGNEARASVFITYDDPVPALEASLAASEARADALQSSLNASNANLTAARADVAAAAAALAVLEGDQNATEGDLAAARGNLSAANDRVSGLETQVATLNSQLTSTQSRVAALEAPARPTAPADNTLALLALILAAVAAALAAVGLVRGGRGKQLTKPPKEPAPSPEKSDPK